MMRASDVEVSFSALDVCRAAGVSYRQLDYWARTGLVVPSVRDARGSGSQRRYSETDLARIKVVALLLSVGVSLWAIRRAGWADLERFLERLDYALLEARGLLVDLEFREKIEAE